MERGADAPEVDLDHAATTRLRDEARAAMAPFLADRYGNPSGAHALARDAVRAVDEAREQVAEALGCAPGEVVFTSGGTEADAHAVTGGLPVRPGTPVCSAVEHHAVLDPVRVLGGRTVAVDRLGRVDLGALAATLDELAAGEHGVAVVSVMAANNEVGTVNDLDAVAGVVERHAPGTPLHTDAVQAVAWLAPTAWAAADLVSASAHKFGGPKGAGVLVVRAGTPLRPLLHGGGQERGRRSGTTDVAGVVGLATALAATAAGREHAAAATRARRDRLADELTAALDGVAETVAVRRGDGTVDRAHLLPSICHLTVDGVGSEELLLLLDRAGVRASAASSCASGAAEASHVLAAIGVDTGADRAALRLSLGHDTTDADVDAAVAAVVDAVDRIRDHRGARAGA